MTRFAVAAKLAIGTPARQESWGLTLIALWLILSAGCEGESGKRPGDEARCLRLIRMVSLGRSVSSLAMSPDGSEAYVAMSGAEPAVVDAGSGDVQWVLGGVENCQFICCASSGRIIAGSSSGRLSAWERGTWRLLESRDASVGRLLGMALDDEAGVLVVVGERGLATFDVDSLASRGAFRLTSTNGGRVAIAGSPGILAIGGIDEICLFRREDLSAIGSVRLTGLDREGGRGPVTGAPFGPNEVSALCYAPWNEAVLVGSSTGLEIVSVVQSGGATLVPGVNRIVTSIEVFPESRRAFLGDDMGNIYVVGSEAKGRILVRRAHKSPIAALVRSPGEKLLVSGGSDGEVRFWQVKQIHEDGRLGAKK